MLSEGVLTIIVINALLVRFFCGIERDWREEEMAFIQDYKKVVKVINIDSLSDSESGESFKQSYEDIYEVINTTYDTHQLEAINPLVEDIISMNNEQSDKFYSEIAKRSYAYNDDSGEFLKLNKSIANTDEKKAGILEYIKGGTITVQFANVLLNLIKTIINM